MGAGLNKPLALPKFASDVVVDVGASNATQGNMRLYLYDKHGEELAQQQTTVGDAPFTQPADFTDGFAQKIIALLQANAEQLANDPLESVVGMVPGSVVTVNGQPVIASPGNLQTGDGIRLKNIQMGPVIEQLKASVANLLRADNDGGVKLVITNDMPGGMAYIAHELFGSPANMEKHNIVAGEKAMLIMTGGGMGVGFVSHIPAINGQPAWVELNASEAGNAIRHAASKSMEKDAASVHALINNFTQALATSAGITLTDEQQASIKGVGKVVTMFDEAQAVIPNLTEDAHAKAATAAIAAYVDELAYFIQLNGLNMVNKVVLSGPLASGINGYVGDLPDDSPLKQVIAQAKELADKDERFGGVYASQQSPLAKLILSDMWAKYTDDHTKSVLAQLNQQTPFRLITDIDIPTNALGGVALKNAELIGPNQNPTRLLLTV